MMWWLFFLFCGTFADPTVRRLLTKRRSTGAHCPAPQRILNCVFAVADTNSDARLSHQELSQALQGRDTCVGDANTIMRLCDADRDTFLTRQDVLSSTDTCLESCHVRKTIFDSFSCSSSYV